MGSPMDWERFYTIQKVTDTFVLISDNNRGLSVTNAARHIVSELHERLKGGIGHRRLYYRDSTGRFDELMHEGGRYSGFLPCSEGQQAFLSGQVTRVPVVPDRHARCPFL